MGDGPSHLAVYSDGKKIYIANTLDGTVVCISPESDLLGKVPSGCRAHIPKVVPSERLINVAKFLNDTLSEFDAQTLERVAHLDTETYPHSLPTE